MPFYFTPYIILPLLSAVINAILAGIALRERKVPAALPIFLITLSLCIWSLASTIDTAATILAVKIICRKISATAACVTAPALLALSLEVAGLRNSLTRRLIILATVIPLISTLLFWTSDFHTLQLYSYHLHQSGPLLLLESTKGTFFTFGHYGYIMAIYFIAIAIFASGYWRFPRSEWTRFTCLIIAALVPVTIELFKLTPLKGFSFTSSSFFISGAFYFTAIFRHWLLDLVPIARETLIEIMADPVIVVNRSGQLALANHAARRMFNLPEEFTGVSLSAADNQFPQLAAIITDHSDLNEECILKDGPEQRSWQIMKTRINQEGTHQGWIISLKDITSLRKANEALQSSNNLLTMLSLAVEQSPVSIVITDLQGTIEFVNPKFVEITGYTKEEALGQNPRILKTGKTPPEAHKKLWEEITNGRVWEGELTNKKKNGDIFIEHARITPIINRDGQITHYLAFKEDITARKNVEEELRRLNFSLLGRIDEETRRRMDQERLLANQARLVAMGEMIGAIAHQWRQPLATLAMIVQRMHAVGCMQALTHEQLDEFKGNAMRQIKYMSDTIEEFRGFYDKDKQTELFSPYKCITDAVRLFEPQFTSGNIRVVIQTVNTFDQRVTGFPNEFKQVILNLLGNARDAITESRLIKGIPGEGLINIDVSITEDRKMIIDISDNGIGIPDKIANRIFDPYFTTKEEHGGTGIGLYMSRMIMQESLGGFLSLLKSGEGTVFRIKLPLGELP